MTILIGLGIVLFLLISGGLAVILWAACAAGGELDERLGYDEYRVDERAPRLNVPPRPKPAEPATWKRSRPPQEPPPPSETL